MAQSALTVTPTNPTPPTNFASVFLGTTPPTAPAQTTIDDGSSTTTTVFAANRASVDNTNFPGVAAEGAGTETLVTAPGSRAECPTVSVSDLGAYTNLITNGPNSTHASSLSPSGNPTLTGLAPNNIASGSGTVSLTVTGANYSRAAVVYIDGVAQTTTFTNSTTLVVPAAAKKATAGNRVVQVQVGGVVSGASNWTFT